MKKIILVVFLFIAILSCSKIKYWNNTNNEKMISDKTRKKQFYNIINSDPKRDSYISYILRDYRLVGVTSLGSTIPGVINDLDILNIFQSKDIWGTTDVNRDEKLYLAAYLYAYNYNINLLTLLNKINYINYFDEKDKNEIFFFIKKYSLEKKLLHLTRF